MNDFCYNHDVFASFPLEHHEPQQSTLSNSWTVQIHTTDITQPATSGGNSFRRSNHNHHEEIKSEHIKSENETTSAIKDRINTIPTPPTRSSSSAGGGVAEVHKKIVAEEKTARPKAKNLLALPEIYKCKKCPFLSLSLANLELHISAAHDEQVNYENNFIRTKCPGCDNIFYVTNSLLVHLREDHLLCLEDATKLLDACNIQRDANVDADADNRYFADSSSGNTNGDHETICNINVSDSACASTSQVNDMQNGRNGRIYLKNVDCLREPTNECVEQSRAHVTTVPENALYDNMCGNELNAFTDHCGSVLVDVSNNLQATTNLNVEEIAFFNNVPPVNKPKQKISIKSVDVLREPTLLRRDYDMQNFPLFSNTTSELNSTSLNGSEQFFVYDNSNNNNDRNAAMTMTCNNNATCNISEIETFEKERRPKIYIKNVDILKKSMDQSHTQNQADEASMAIKYNFTTENIADGANTFLNAGDTFNSLTSAFDICNVPLGGSVSAAEQYLFENTSNILPNVSEVEDLSLANGIGNYQLLDDIRFTSSVDCVDVTAVTPTITEATPSPPPPPPQPPPLPSAVTSISINDFKALPSSNIQLMEPMSVPKQKIFIKNVDVLKAPQFQETRRTLHLRTVDELNLMNKNEVENLIAPNLESTSEETPYAKVSQSLLTADGSDGGFKLHDFGMSEATGWSTDYDLGDELDCIITETIGPVTHLNTTHLNGNGDCVNSLSPSLTLQKDMMTLISLPNIDQNMTSDECVVEQQQQQLFTQPTESIALIETPDVSLSTIDSADSLLNTPFKVNSVEVNVSPSPHEVETIEKALNADMPLAQLPPPPPPPPAPPPLAPVEKNCSSDITPPPLAPVTNSNDHAPDLSLLSTATNKMSVPVPPLVPVSPLIQMRAQQAPEVATNAKQLPPFNGGSSSIVTNEKGRIYVANNLLQQSNKSVDNVSNIAVAPTSGGTSVRGRPFGAKNANTSKANKQLCSNAETDKDLKCTVHGCVFRFKKPATLDYHKRCHGAFSNCLSGIICPDCNASFTNWNTLHTHLWRAHQIDIELYSCKLCNFKTPIYSRLVNTHAKIHFDERNYKCDECTKAFKNTKQLKNHRRWHRIHGGRVEETGTMNSETPTVHRCKDCGSAFSHRKTLQEHSCKANAEKTPIKCDICERVLSSKSALKLHKQTHDQTKRYKCAVCSYTTSDHNAYRRHKLTHSNSDSQKMYNCPHCSYKSIQSLCYKNHVQRKHPELAGSTIYKCDNCCFSTINRSLYVVHQSKHEMSTNTTSNTTEADVLPATIIDVNLLSKKG